jgi:hypothetical protein
MIHFQKIDPYHFWTFALITSVHIALGAIVLYFGYLFPSNTLKNVFIITFGVASAACWLMASVIPFCIRKPYDVELGTANSFAALLSMIAAICNVL